MKSSRVGDSEIIVLHSFSGSRVGHVRAVLTRLFNALPPGKV